MTHSLQTRLLGGVAVGALSVLAVAGLVLDSLMRTSLTGEFDDALAVHARTLAAMVETEGGRIWTEMSERAPANIEPTGRPDYYELWGEDGTVIERSPQLGDRDLDRVSGPLDTPTIRSTTLPNGAPGRLAGVKFNLPLGTTAAGESVPDGAAIALGDRATVLIMVVARDTVELDNRIARIRMLMWVVFSGAALCLLLVSTPIVRLGLRPLRITASQIESFDGRNVGARLETDDAPDEIRTVVDRLNDLLGRVAAGIRREREFSANVAHELRTPLAGLRSTIEVVLSRSRSSGEYQQALANCLNICRQTECIVETLLSLAKVQSDRCVPPGEALRLDEILHEAWKPFAPRAAALGAAVHWTVSPAITVHTDRSRFQTIFHNLFDNAVAYCNQRGAIEVQTESLDGEMNIHVRNTGCGLTTAELDRVFDRFWRGASGRGDTGRHAGLGLALCRELAHSLQMGISVDLDDGGWFQITLSILNSHWTDERVASIPNQAGFPLSADGPPDRTPVPKAPSAVGP